jgi:hypothetical protein
VLCTQATTPGLDLASVLIAPGTCKPCVIDAPELTRQTDLIDTIAGAISCCATNVPLRTISATQSHALSRRNLLQSRGGKNFS